MKQKKNALSLVAKSFAGIGFLTVFVLNLILFTTTEVNGLSIEPLKAFAQSGGSNAAEESGGYASSSNLAHSYKIECWGTIPGDPTGQEYEGEVEVTCTGMICNGVGTVSCTPAILNCNNGPCIGI